jgi:hypothetical protein
MATVIRPEVSEKNKYWIEKHRHYELKHFCLQYPYWKQILNGLGDIGVSSTVSEIRSNDISDPTSMIAMKRLDCKRRMELVENAAREADETLYPYILKAVTEGLSYNYLRTKLQMPCGRDMYYDRYRKFFWILNKSRK